MQANELFTQPNTILLDGGMGTMLQAVGLKLGARPEELNITDPQLIESIHGRYAAAGSRIINANTFGASAHKLAGSEYTLEEIIAAGIANCKRACAPYGALTALDVGPLGELLEPNGTLAFEDAVAEYGRIVRAGVAAGADLVFLETFTDLYELKAALLAVKENSSLPVLASMSFEAGGRTFTGCTVESFAATARGLGADAVGINCSLGPKEIFPMAKRLAEAVPGNFPVFVKPNAGLPRADGSGYDITPQLFALQMKPYRELHLFAAGGCCGTTPEFIKLLNGTFAGCTPGRPAHRMPSVLCTPVDTVTVDGITVVGERINPTGKKRFQQALREGDMNYVLEQAVSQAEAGAQILDVNVGAPGVDEPVLMEQVVKALQSVTSLPLQLDSSNVEALARGLRVYNGKPIVNSTNGEPEKLAAMVPEHQHGPVRRVIFRAESQEILQGLRRTHICVGQRVHHLQGIPRVHIPPQLPGLHRRVGPFVAAAGFNHHGHVLRQGNLFHFHEVTCGRLILALQVRAAQIPVDRPALPLGVVRSRRLICRQSTVRLLRLLLRAARKGKDQANCQQKRDPSLRLHSYKHPSAKGTDGVMKHGCFRE